MANGTPHSGVGHKAQLVQDPALLRAYSALKTVQMLGISEGSSTIQVPMIVVCGTQSAGKTTFIETLIGWPVGHTDRGTATRCPVRYILRNDDSAYSVNGKSLRTRQDVRAAVKEHMITLGRKELIVPEVLVVEISEKTVIDLDITDLPGLKMRTEPDYVPIADITRSFLHDPSVMPIVMCKASESYQTQLDLDSMMDLGLNVKRSLVVMNYFNKHLYDMSHISDLNRYCNGQQSKYPMVRFIMLHYKDGIHKDRMSFEELSDYYQTLPAKEEEAFEGKVAAMQADETLARAVRQNFGVTSVSVYMQRLLHDWMLKNQANMRGWLKDRLAALNSQLEELRDALKQEDPQSIARMWRDYITDFERVMAAMHSAALTNVKRLSRESPFAPKYQWAFTMAEAGVTTTYAAERALVQSDPPQHWLSPEQLREELTGTWMESILDDALSPHAAYARLLHVASYMIMALPMRPFTKDEIISKSEHSRDGAMHSFNKHTVVKQLVTERLFHLQSILGEMMLHIRAIYEAPLPKVHEALQENYPVVSRHADFLRQLDDRFKQLLMDALTKTNSSLQDMIEEKTRFFGVDLPNRLLTLVALTPLRQDILLEDPMAAYEHENNEAGTLKMTAKDVLLRKAGGLRKTPSVLTREENPDIPERVPQQRQAVMHVKQALHKYHDQFCLVDFVEGGLQDLTQVEYRSINVTEINKEGEQYFLILKGLIVWDVETKLNRNVYEPLKNKLLLDAMTKGMLAVVDNIMQDEDQVRRITGSNAEMLAKDIEVRERQVELIKDALNKLQAVGDGLGQGIADGPQRQPTGPQPLRQHELGVDGVVHLPNMELSRLPPAFRPNFVKAAVKDASEAFAHPPRLARVIALRAGGGILVDYVLEARTPEEIPRVKAAVDRAQRKRICFPHAGGIYCQALGADLACAEHFGLVENEAAWVSSPVPAVQSPAEKKGGRKDEKPHPSETGAQEASAKKTEQDTAGSEQEEIEGSDAPGGGAGRSTEKLGKSRARRYTRGSAGREPGAGEQGEA